MSSDTAAGRAGYFNRLYEGDADPWRYHTGAYEFAKRADTLTFLRDHYARGCEVGCSIGVLTADLAPRCDRLLGIDISPVAAALARRDLAAMPQVDIAVMHLPHQRPSGRFDLLVLSEVLYFLDPDELRAMAALAGDLVEPGGDLLIVSFDGETQTRLDGPASTAVFLAHADAFDLLRAEQRQHYHVRLLRCRNG